MKIESFDEMTLGQHARLVEIDNDATLSDIDREVMKVSMVTGIRTSDLYNMPITSYEKFAAKAAYLNEPKPKVRKVADRYNIAGWNLLLCKDISKMTTAQFVDYQEHARQGHPVWMVLSCFLVPEGKKYNDDYDIAKLWESLRDNMTVTEADAICSFVLRRWMSSAADTLTYLRLTVPWMLPRKTRRQIRRAMKLTERSIRTLGDGLL